MLVNSTHALIKAFGKSKENTKKDQRTLFHYKMDSFLLSNLPHELLLHIFSFLKKEDLLNLQITCKTFFNIAHDNSLKNLHWSENIALDYSKIKSRSLPIEEKIKDLIVRHKKDWALKKIACFTLLPKNKIAFVIFYKDTLHKSTDFYPNVNQSIAVIIYDLTLDTVSHFIPTRDYCVRFTPSKHRLVHLNDNEVIYYNDFETIKINYITSTLEYIFPNTDTETEITRIADNKIIIKCSDNRMLIFIDTSTKEERVIFQSQHPGIFIKKFKLLDDDRIVVLMDLYQTPTRAYIWDIKKNRIIQTLSLPERTALNKVVSLFLNGNHYTTNIYTLKNKILAFAVENQIHFYDFAHPEGCYVKTLHSPLWEQIYDVTEANNNHVIARLAGNALCIWNIETNQCIHRIEEKVTIPLLQDGCLQITKSMQLITLIKHDKKEDVTKCRQEIKVHTFGLLKAPSKILLANC